MCTAVTPTDISRVSSEEDHTIFTLKPIRAETDVDVCRTYENSNTWIFVSLVSGVILVDTMYFMYKSADLVWPVDATTSLKSNRINAYSVSRPF